MIDSPASSRSGANSRVHSYKLPEEYKPLADKYSEVFRDRKFSRELIDPQDFADALEIYATDCRFDLYSLMDVFHCSRATLYALLQSKEFAPLYEAAKESRADAALKRGWDVTEETYYGAMNGDIGRDAVNAAKNLANYSLAYAQLISSRYGKKGDNEGLSVQIAVPQFSNLGNGPKPDAPVEVEAEVVDSADQRTEN